MVYKIECWNSRKLPRQIQGDPESYEYIKQVWTVWNNHVMNDLLLQYIFQLSCCYKSSCTHPFCTLGIHKELKWYNSEQHPSRDSHSRQTDGSPKKIFNLVKGTSPPTVTANEKRT